MPVSEWKPRLEAIRRNCERLDDLVKKAGYESEDAILGTMKIGPTATERELQQAEEQLGFALPESFRKVMLEFSASFDAWWHLPDLPIPLFTMRPFDARWGKCDWSWGGCCWDLEDIVDINRRDYDTIVQIYSRTEDEDDRRFAMDFFEKRRFWLEIGNGDALMMRIDRPDSQEICYFLHDGWVDDGFGAVLGQNFEDFIDRWMQLAFVGPEIWDLKDLLEPDGLAPEIEPGRAFREWFFVE